jgi:sporulation protein YlmC with PRC-barrel domain
MSSTGYLKREALIGKSVVTKNAEIMGTVLDIAITTDGKLAIQVQKKDQSAESDSDLFVNADQIQAVGDVILLKGSSDSSSNVATAAPMSASVPSGPVVSPPPPPGTLSQSKTCQKCGYLNAPNAKFCIKCGASLL